MTFQELGLMTPILTALGDLGYEKPSPIQEKAVPPALAGRDVLGCAQTGTGKTCAFAAPILQQLTERPDQKHHIRALILTPTRELAIQIQESIEAYGKYLKLRSVVIFGGVGQGPQVERIQRGADILVATPGRLADLYQQKLLDFTHLEIFVLDEADRMLDMGFIHDVKKILKWLPRKKQTLFFSATMPPEIASLVDSLLRDPVRVAVDPVSSPVEVIDQKLYYVDRGNKTKLLAALMGELGVKNALIFTRTKHGANRVAADLVKQGITAAAIHGNKSQTARQQALADFKSGKVRALVATDIAARGLDIEELSHVFNYNLPDVPETYVHRIGRTGRAGHGGTAVSFCDINEKDELKSIEKLLGRPIPVVENHQWPMEVFEPLPKDKKGRVVNPEDAEARAAAKERRRARDAANKAAAEARKAAEELIPAKERKKLEKLEKAEKAEQETEKPQRSARRRGGRKPAAETQPAAEPRQKQVRQEKPRPEAAAPVEAPESTVSRRKHARGYRASATLEEALRATAPHYTEEELKAQSEVQYYHNPLEGDVVLDATARLLAPRSTRSSQPAAQRKQTEGRKNGRNRPAAPAGEKSRRKPAPAKGREEKASVEAPARKQSPKSHGTSGAKSALEVLTGKKRGNNKRRSGGGGPREPQINNNGVKDSTELSSSLMKPYYISDDC